jgi:hypothetical protein
VARAKAAGIRTIFGEGWVFRSASSPFAVGFGFIPPQEHIFEVAVRRAAFSKVNGAIFDDSLSRDPLQTMRAET